MLAVRSPARLTEYALDKTVSAAIQENEIAAEREPKRQLWEWTTINTGMITGMIAISSRRQPAERRLGG